MEGAKVPLIEFSREKMERGSNGWVLTMNAVRSALEEYGCFEATYNEIDTKVNDDLRDTLEKLFNFDSETKRLFTSDVKIGGYTRQEDPLHEAMRIYDALEFHNIEEFIHVLFPGGNANMQICETIHLYVTKIWKLENVVRRMVFESFGVEDYFDEQEKSIRYILKFMKYESGATKESRGRELFPHYDKNFLTILHEYGANGLQVKARDSGQWIRPTLSGSSFLIIAGEKLYGWSNARVQCAMHRVNMNEDEDFKTIRYSIGLFSSQDGIVRIPSEVVDEKHPLLFKPFENTGLTQAFSKEIENFQDYNGDHITPTLKKHYAI